MPKSLVIIESRSNTKTLKNFLGNDFMIKACMGNGRDLSESEFGVDGKGGSKPYGVRPINGTLG